MHQLHQGNGLWVLKRVWIAQQPSPGNRLQATLICNWDVSVMSVKDLSYRWLLAGESLVLSIVQRHEHETDMTLSEWCVCVRLG